MELFTKRLALFLASSYSYLLVMFVIYKTIPCVPSDQPNYQNLLSYFEDVSNWKQLGLYLLPEKYTSRINDIEKNYPQDIAQCRWALITEYLRVGEISWYKIIDAFEKSGNPNIAKKIGKDMLNIDDLSTIPSADHERHDQSTSKFNVCYHSLSVVII